MTEQTPPTLPGEPVNAGQHAQWIAGRVQTLLSHYFSPELSPEVREAAIDDWIGALASFPRDAISAACEGYLRDQPRRRPTPGDIAARVGGWQQQRARQSLGREGATDAHRRAVEWAVMTGRLTRDDAWSAVGNAADMQMPEWVGGDDVQRCVYAIRHHPNMMTPDEGGVAAYRKMVRS